MTQVVDVLAQTLLFDSVEQVDLEALAAVVYAEHFAAGALVFAAGDPGESMYIIQRGEVRIFSSDAQGHELTLMHYGAGEIFGEFALIDHKPRSASAMVVSDGLDVFVLHRDDLLAFIARRPQVSFAMMQSLAQRARYTTTYLETAVTWLKRLAAGEYQAALEEMAQSEQSKDNQIPPFIGAFMQTVNQVQEREARLQQEVVRLQVEIDQNKRQTQVNSITGSDFFASLKAQAKELREQNFNPTSET